MASGTMHPHHDSELISWYHDAFLPWDHYLNNIVLSYHDSPITRSHFMDPTDRAIEGFYCIWLNCSFGYLTQLLIVVALKFPDVLQFVNEAIKILYSLPILTSAASSAMYKAVSGVCSAVFMILTLPMASIGAHFQHCINRGKFQGMICPQTPTGSWRV